MDLTAVLPRLERLYGERAARPTLSRIETAVTAHGLGGEAMPSSRWSEKDTVLITYGDQVRGEGVSALEAQRRWLLDNGLRDAISCVHLLPFFPYTSDDGFSVSDYRAVDPAAGDWSDVDAFGGDFDLMYDLVLNHCSQEHEWFRNCLARKEPYTHYFHAVDPTLDLSGVTRPRSLPLLHEFQTDDGPRHFWTTFSRDQLDLNFAHPDVLVEMLDVLLLYVARGAKIVRLDAIAYLWKEIGTNCIHLPQTHEVVKLMRDVLDAAAPGVILLTETNVPHAENVSYFGDPATGDEGHGDEAHMVYQFSLAPLLLDAVLHEDATYLNAWLSTLQPPRPGTTYFNFTASHDGVGVRPLEGLVPEQRKASLMDHVARQGAAVSMKANADGGESPYEINGTYFSLVGGETDDVRLRRFLSTQQIMLSLQGIPGVYFQSFLAAENWQEGVKQTGRARTINRRKYNAGELTMLLATEPTRADALEAMRKMLVTRRRTPQFHPDVPQAIHEPDPRRLVMIERPGEDGSVWCVANVTREAVEVTMPSQSVDVIDGEPLERQFTLRPFETRWLAID